MNLYLAKFLFTTDGKEGNDFIIVEASNESEAEQLAKKWFNEIHKGGIILATAINEKISANANKNVTGVTHINPLNNPANHNLFDIFRELKFGRPAEDQKFLDECIYNLGLKRI